MRISSPFFGLSGIILNLALSKLTVFGCSVGVVSVGCTGGGVWSIVVFPVVISFPLVSMVLQFIPGLATSVFMPNLTDSPGLSGWAVVNTSRPWAVFVPVQPFSVLNDLKSPASFPSHILTVFISTVSLFVNSTSVVFSKPVIFAPVWANALGETSVIVKAANTMRLTTRILYWFTINLSSLINLFTYPF